MLCKVTHRAGRVSTNARPHQQCYGDREIRTAMSCTKCSQVAGIIQRAGRGRRSSEASSLRAAVMDKAWYVSPSAKVSLLL